MFPQLDRHAIKTEKIWNGRCDLSRTGLPVLLDSAKGFYYASGFSGQGMVNTALYGKAIAEKIISGTSEKFNALARLNPAFMPPLIKGYLRAGAWVCGEPAWDPDFNTADILLLLPLSRFNARYPPLREGCDVKEIA